MAAEVVRYYRGGWALALLNLEDMGRSTYGCAETPPIGPALSREGSPRGEGYSLARRGGDGDLLNSMGHSVQQARNLHILKLLERRPQGCPLVLRAHRTNERARVVILLMSCSIPGKSIE